MQRLASLLVLAALPTLGVAQQAVNVDYESGTLGWVGPVGGTGQSAIDPVGGVGGGAGYRIDFSDFFITVRNGQNAAFTGDYTQFDSVTLSTDLRVDQVDFFFSPVPRPWLVELRNTKLAQGGYPWTSVWFKFTDISAATHGSWTNFSVTISDPDATTLPAGWQGYGAEDPVTFAPILPPGVTFADVLAGVDEVVWSTAEPGWFFGQTDFDFTMDNTAISTTGGPWADLGQGLAGASGVPHLFGAGPLTDGSPNFVGMSGAASGSLAFVAVGSSQLNLPLLGGTLVSSADVAVLSLPTTSLGTLALPFSWPKGLPSGLPTYLQAWVLDAGAPQGVAASNGLVATTP